MVEIQTRSWVMFCILDDLIFYMNYLQVCPHVLTQQPFPSVAHPQICHTRARGVFAR